MRLRRLDWQLTGLPQPAHDAVAPARCVPRLIRAYEVSSGPVSNDFQDIDLVALGELNELRRGGPSQRRSELEREFSSRLGAERRLAVYGSLAPGRSNHHQLQPLRGEWRSRFSVKGDLLDRGWGAGIGFPALRWSMAGPPLAIELFVSDDLPRHWARLDEFEGADYLRIVVPVYSATTPVTLANLYGAR